MYIGTTKQLMNTRINEHRRQCRFDREIEKSSVAEHALINRNHKILFEDTQVLSSTEHYHTYLYQQAIQIFKRVNFNKKKKG